MFVFSKDIVIWCHLAGPSTSDIHGLHVHQHGKTKVASQAGLVDGCHREIWGGQIFCFCLSCVYTGRDALTRSAGNRKDGEKTQRLQRWYTTATVRSHSMENGNCSLWAQFQEVSLATRFCQWRMLWDAPKDAVRQSCCDANIFWSPMTDLFAFHWFSIWDIHRYSLSYSNIYSILLQTVALQYFGTHFSELTFDTKVLTLAGGRINEGLMTTFWF